MAQNEKNILREAVADAKAIKAAAVKNAQALVLESLKDNVRSMVDDVLNEGHEDRRGTYDAQASSGGGHDEQEEVSEGSLNQDDSKDMGKSFKMQRIHEGDTDMENEALSQDDSTEKPKVNEAEHEDEHDEDHDEDDLEGEDDLGLSEDDLEEALAEALNLDKTKVHDFTDPEWITPEKHEVGILPQDLKKEEGWEKKEAVAKLDLSLKEAATKIARLVKENVMLKKANGVLKGALEETKLFNHKLMYATKLMQREGLSSGMKKQIVSKLDEATSVREVKSLYESFNMALTAVMTESTKGKEVAKKSSLAEALGSGRGTQTGKGVSVVNEGQSDLARRFQQIAGMIKE